MNLNPFQIKLLYSHPHNFENKNEKNPAACWAIQKTPIVTYVIASAAAFGNCLLWHYPINMFLKKSAPECSRVLQRAPE